MQRFGLGGLGNMEKVLNGAGIVEAHLYAAALAAGEVLSIDASRNPAEVVQSGFLQEQPITPEVPAALTLAMLNGLPTVEL